MMMTIWTQKNRITWWYLLLCGNQLLIQSYILFCHIYTIHGRTSCRCLASNTFANFYSKQTSFIFDTHAVVVGHCEGDKTELQNGLGKRTAYGHFEASTSQCSEEPQCLQNYSDAIYSSMELSYSDYCNLSQSTTDIDYGNRYNGQHIGGALIISHKF